MSATRLLTGHEGRINALNKSKQQVAQSTQKSQHRVDLGSANTNFNRNVTQAEVYNLPSGSLPTNAR